MKVLHLVGSLEDAGGILSVIRHLKTATESRGLKHTVLVHEGYAETRRPALDYRRSRFICSEMESHWGIFWRAAFALLETRRLLARESFDLMHAHTRCGFLVGWGLARWPDRPVLFTNHDYARRLGMYRRAARSRNFHTVLLTPNMARHYGFEEQPPKINIISACCGDSFFGEPLARRTSAASGDATIRLLGAGSLLRWKKWDLLAHAVRQLRPEERRRVEVAIYGPVVQTDPDSSKYEMELRRLLAEHGLEGQLQLKGSTSAVSEAMRQADWFILPSTNEPCSVGLMEALALGLPALVSASGGNLDIVRAGETGLFFEPDNAKDLADKLRTILNGHASVWPPEQIRESVRARSASAVGDQYEKLYRRLVSAGHPPDQPR